MTTAQLIEINTLDESVREAINALKYALPELLGERGDETLSNLGLLMQVIDIARTEL